MSKRQVGEPRRAARPIVAGRQTQPRDSLLKLLPYNYIPRRRYERYDISGLENSSLSASALLGLLPDVSSDVGLAVWNTLRLGSLGFGSVVKDQDGQDDPQATAFLNALLGRVNASGGGLSGLISQWLQSAYLQGAVAGEAPLRPGLRDVEDFYPVDPASIEFGRAPDGGLVAWQNTPSGKVQLNPETFWYIPVDPWIDEPYGRPPAAPALQEVWFDIAFMTDLRRAVHNQGWPRIDLKLMSDVVANLIPQDIRGNPDEEQRWLNARLADVQQAYNDLQPDDSFAHYDFLEVTQAQDGGRLFDPSAVLRAIERRLIKALKQMPILMASNEGTTETHGTVQWQIYVAGLQSLQNVVACLIGRMMELALRASGREGRVECRFAGLDTADRLKDAQEEALRISNAIAKWRAGFQTWEESAIEVTGSAPPEGAMEPDPDASGPADARGSLARHGHRTGGRRTGGRTRAGDGGAEGIAAPDRLDDELARWLDFDDGALPAAQKPAL